MANIKRKLLITMALFILLSVNSFAEENLESVCGIWVDSKAVKYSLAIEKINEGNYFVSYIDNVDKYTFDFTGLATVYDEKRMYYIKEKDVFYIYYDSVRDVVYVLWNHDTPDGEYFDFGLERVTKLYDEEYQKKLKEEKEKQLYEAVKKKLLEEWNNE